MPLMRTGPSYAFMKWSYFLLLLLTAPALLFLVQAFMTLPAIFFAAGIFYMIPEALQPSRSMESLTFIGFFAIHLLIFAGLYLLLSMLFAKLLSLIHGAELRRIAFAALCVVTVAATIFPLYGSGGHGATTWRNLPGVLSDINASYGPLSVIAVYGGAALCALAIHTWRRRRRSRIF